MMTEDFPIKILDKTCFTLIKEWSSTLYFRSLGRTIFLMTFNFSDRGASVIGSMKKKGYHMF